MSAWYSHAAHCSVASPSELDQFLPAEKTQVSVVTGTDSVASPITGSYNTPSPSGQNISYNMYNRYQDLVLMIIITIQDHCLRTSLENLARTVLKLYEKWWQEVFTVLLPASFMKLILCTATQVPLLVCLEPSASMAELVPKMDSIFGVNAWHSVLPSEVILKAFWSVLKQIEFTWWMFLHLVFQT